MIGCRAFFCLLCALAAEGFLLGPSLLGAAQHGIRAGGADSLAAGKGGMGGGMGASAKPRRGAKGMGRGKKKGKSAPPVDMGDLMKRSEKLYEELEIRAAKDEGAAGREYVITARARLTDGEQVAAENAVLYDWCPVATLFILTDADRAEVHQDILTGAVRQTARETLFSSAGSVPSIGNVPRHLIEYAVESFSSFFDHVYPEFESHKGEDDAMSKAQALDILGCEADADARAIKRAYFKLMQQLHPDTLEGDGTAEEKAEFLRVQQAYDAVGGSMGTASSTEGRTSWYEALGGKGRTDFSGPLVISGGIGEAPLGLEMSLELGGWRAAVNGIEPDLAKYFAARNRAHYMFDSSSANSD
ncbi:unnamed protein product [Chrysoparadoxa australica]